MGRQYMNSRDIHSAFHKPVEYMKFADNSRYPELQQPLQQWPEDGEGGDGGDDCYYNPCHNHGVLLRLRKPSVNKVRRVSKIVGTHRCMLMQLMAGMDYQQGKKHLGRAGSIDMRS